MQPEVTRHVPWTSPGTIHADSQSPVTMNRPAQASQGLNLCLLAGHLRHLSLSLASFSRKDLDPAVWTLLTPDSCNPCSPFLSFPWSLRAIPHLTPPGLPTHTELAPEEPPKPSANAAECGGCPGMCTQASSQGLGDRPPRPYGYRNHSLHYRPLLRCERHEGRGLPPFCLLLPLWLLGQGQAQGRQSKLLLRLQILSTLTCELLSYEEDTGALGHRRICP